MPTPMYLRSGLSDVSRGTNDTTKGGVASAWRARQLSPTISTTANVTATVATVTGPTAGLETGAPVNEWISPPLAAAVTISGNITLNICAFESNAMANATVGVVIQRLNNTLAAVSNIADTSFVTELGTTNGRRTWTVTPTSTAMGKGERIRVKVYFDDNATTTNMVSGYTLTLTYDGTNAATGDSNVTFTENLTFMSSPAIGWSSTSASFGAGNIRVVEYSDPDNTFIAAGSSYTGYSTNGGSTWTAATTIAGTIYGGVYASGVDLFVLVGNGGQIQTSPTGVTWTSRTSNVTNDLNAIAYNATANRSVACSGGGEIITSTNGTAWTTVKAAVANEFLTAIAVNAAGTLWAAVGNDGSTAENRLYTSTNGTTWTIATNPIALFRGLHWSNTNGLWIAGSSAGDLYTSTDLVTWTVRFQSTALPSSVQFADSGSRIVATLDSVAVTSTDGITWERILLPGANTTNGVAYGATAGRWVAGYSNTMVVSADGVDGIVAPAQRLYLTGTTSDIVNQGSTELTVWTTPGVS